MVTKGKSKMKNKEEKSYPILDYWPYVLSSERPIFFYITEYPVDSTNSSGPMVTFDGTNTS